MIFVTSESCKIIHLRLLYCNVLIYFGFLYLIYIVIQKVMSSFFIHGPDKTFLVPATCKATVRTGNKHYKH